jgi:hypothetical protein
MMSRSGVAFSRVQLGRSFLCRSPHRHVVFSIAGVSAVIPLHSITGYTPRSALNSKKAVDPACRGSMLAWHACSALQAKFMWGSRHIACLCKGATERRIIHQKPRLILGRFAMPILAGLAAVTSPNTLGHHACIPQSCPRVPARSRDKQNLE